MDIDYNPGYEWQAELKVKRENETWYWRTDDAALLFD